MDDLLAERMTNLEIKLAFQDQFIRELDEVVRFLSGRLEATERALSELRQAARAPAAPLGPADEPPPHY